VLKNWKEVGLNVSADNAILLGDHEIFTESVRQQVVALNLPVLTTEKDFQRNRGFFEDLGLPYFVLKQELYEQEDKLKVWVSEHISSCVDRKPG
jgi:tetraacyldisaccharide-1-P 4'-kinase